LVERAIFRPARDQTGAVAISKSITAKTPAEKFLCDASKSTRWIRIRPHEHPAALASIAAGSRKIVSNALRRAEAPRTMPLPMPQT
jgi:hypothetical protein